MTEILTQLNTNYPDTLPRTDLSAFERGRLVGRRDVVDYLTELLNEKEDARVQHAQGS